MADSTWAPNLTATAGAAPAPRHTLLVRLTHWLAALTFFALLLSGVEILISHPRFYWGETGNSATTPLFQIPVPASRASVPTGYNYVLPDQNGWSRALHFQAAWLFVLTGFFYVLSGHFRKSLMPKSGELSAVSVARSLSDHIHLKPPAAAEYNILQKLSYLKVIFLLTPLMIWTGLAMSPAITAAFPFIVESLGGQQSARTIHFVVSVSLVLFLFIHVVMVWRAGFIQRTRAMITGRPANQKENP